MAGYNEILTGRYNRAMQKLLSMKGPASVNELSSIIQATFSLFWGIEMRYLEGWAKFGQGFNLAAGGAGNNSTIRFRNATSNVIAIFEAIMFSSTTGGTLCNIEGPTPTTTDLATNISPFCTRFDARGQQATTLNVTQDNTAPHANNGNTIMTVAPTNQAFFPIIELEDQEIPLLPGDALQIRGPTVNTQVMVSIWWRERQLEDSELK